VADDLQEARGAQAQRGDERVVCLLTGVGFKDASALQRMAEGRAVQPIKVEDILEIT